MIFISLFSFHLFLINAHHGEEITHQLKVHTFADIWDNIIFGNDIIYGDNITSGDNIIYGETLHLGITLYMRITLYIWG